MKIQTIVFMHSLCIVAMLWFLIKPLQNRYEELENELNSIILEIQKPNQVDTIFFNSLPLTYENVYRSIRYNLDYPDIVMAQAILETGYFKSKACLEKNNLFGLVNSKELELMYYSFGHWNESVLAYKKWIQKRYQPPEDYYTFLKRIGYAEDPEYINKLKKVEAKMRKL